MEKTRTPETGKRPSRWIKSTKRFRKDRRGVAAVEMALVAWPFLAIMFAILEQGVVFFAEFSLEHNVAQAARQIRTGEVLDNSITSAQFKTDLVCPDLAAMLTCGNLSVDVRTFATFADIAGALDDPVNSDNEFNPLNNWQPGAQLSVMVVRAFYEWNMLTPTAFTHMDTLANGNRLISASMTFRNEPF
ncbi:MAG: pilus assembly protein [Alphaproteobacteria bacterium]|nr:pilus assembly protein [Alphaproteobacteria bacterium]